MAMTLTLPKPINISLQSKGTGIVQNFSTQSGAWDIIYFIRTSNNVTTGSIYRLGKCTAIDTSGTSTYTITVEPDATAQTPNVNDFIFFGKDRSVNEASIVGYYGEFVFKNNSKQKAEFLGVLVIFSFLSVTSVIFKSLFIFSRTFFITFSIKATFLYFRSFEIAIIPFCLEAFIEDSERTPIFLIFVLNFPGKYFITCSFCTTTIDANEILLLIKNFNI